MNFLKTFHSWNPKLLYNIYEGRKIKNFLGNHHNEEFFHQIINSFKVAWLTPPLLYIGEEDEIFYDKLLNWMEEVSGKKLFEYAYKY